jgi:hypothetical protein
MPDHCVGGPGKRGQSQRWSTFLRHHAKGIIACDFCVVVTATFRVLYVFVMIEHASRRLIHVNVTAHPTAAWVIQQCREAIPADHTYRILIHDRDTIFSKAVDQSVSHMGLHVIKTPVRIPEPRPTPYVTGTGYSRGNTNITSATTSPINTGCQWSSALWPDRLSAVCTMTMDSKSRRHERSRALS